MDVMHKNNNPTAGKNQYNPQFTYIFTEQRNLCKGQEISSSQTTETMQEEFFFIRPELVAS